MQRSRRQDEGAEPVVSEMSRRAFAPGFVLAATLVASVALPRPTAAADAALLAGHAEGRRLALSGDVAAAQASWDSVLARRGGAETWAIVLETACTDAAVAERMAAHRRLSPVWIAGGPRGCRTLAWGAFDDPDEARSHLALLPTGLEEGTSRVVVLRPPLSAWSAQGSAAPRTAQAVTASASPRPAVTEPVVEPTPAEGRAAEEAPSKKEAASEKRAAKKEAAAKKKAAKKAAADQAAAEKAVADKAAADRAAAEKAAAERVAADKAAADRAAAEKAAAERAAADKAAADRAAADRAAAEKAAAERAAADKAAAGEAAAEKAAAERAAADKAAAEKAAMERAAADKAAADRAAAERAAADRAAAEEAAEDMVAADRAAAERAAAERAAVEEPPRSVPEVVQPAPADDPELSPAERAAKLFAEGTAAYARGSLREALTAFQASAALEPRNPSAHNNLGTCWLQLDEAAKAAASFRRAIEIEPTYARAQLNLGIALYRLEQPDEALATLERVLELEPESVDARYNLAAILIDLRRWEEAAPYLEAALALAPGNRQLEVALEQLRQQLSVRDSDVAPVQEQPRVAASTPTPTPTPPPAPAPTAAVATSGCGAQLSQANRARLADRFFQSGLAAYQGRSYEVAELELERALECDPTSPAVLNHLGAARMQLGDTRGAANAFQLALKLDPAHVEAGVNLAFALHGEGQCDESVELLRQLLVPHAASAEVRFHLGRVLYLCGRVVEAGAALEEALALEPSHPGARRLLERIQADRVQIP